MADRGYLLAMRDRARAAGDAGQVRAITADLERLGEPGCSNPPETTAVQLPERAVPPRPRRRQPKHEEG